MRSSPRVGSRDARIRSTAPGSGELRRAEPGDEVAAPDLARLLQRLQHAGRRREAARHAFGEHRLAGQHAVAIEQLQRSGVRRLGRRSAPARAAARPATSGRRRRAARSVRSGRGAAGEPRDVARARDRFRQRPERRQRVVGDLARPDQVPERGAGRRARQRCRRPGPDRARTTRPRSREVLADRVVQLARRRGRPAAAARAAAPGRGSTARPCRRRRRAGRRRSRPARRSRTARRGRRGGTRAPAAGARRARGPTPGSARPAAARSPRRARRDRADGVATPCHAGQEAPERRASTGSTSWRSAASDAGAGARSTSASHHSRSTPPGRNSPCSDATGRLEPRERLAHAVDADAQPRGRLGGDERRRGCARSGRRGRRAGVGRAR